MAITITLTRLAANQVFDMDSPAAFVQIDVAGAEPNRTCQYFVDGVLRGEFVLDAAGEYHDFYAVPPGGVRNALADIGGVSCTREVIDGIELAYFQADSHSLALRYAP